MRHTALQGAAAMLADPAAEHIISGKHVQAHAGQLAADMFSFSPALGMQAAIQA